MIGYTTTTGKYKVGGKFVAYKTRVGEEGEPTYGWYSSELEGWVAGIPDAEVRDVEGGELVYETSDTTGEPIDEVSEEKTFYAVTMSVVGDGAINASPLYGERYAIGGESLTFTTTPGENRRETDFKVNDSVSSKTIASVDEDLNAIVTFCPILYTVRDDGVAVGGTHVIKIDGVTVVGQADATVGKTIEVVATDSIGATFLYTEIDGVRHAGNPTSITIQDRPYDPIFDIKSYFTNTSVVEDSVSVSSGGVAEVRQYGVTIPLAEGKFTANAGATYVVVATPNEGMRVDGFYENGRRVSIGNSYTFIQGTSAREIAIVFARQGGIEVNLFVGADTSSQDTEWENCICRVARPIGSTVGTYTFSPVASEGHHFVRLYIEDTDGTGKGRVIPAGRSYSVVIDFNARVVAIFARDDAPVEPPDEDQGDYIHTTAVLKEWEGSSDKMTARWRSRRNVFTKPIALSSARVCANGYGTTLPVLKVATYESPSTTDGDEVQIGVANQDSFRLPMRRPEKYVEIEVDANARVLEMAVSTSMGGLWQASS